MKTRLSVKQPGLEVAVVGLGVGEQHARAFFATGHCHIRWLYDLDPAKAQKLTDELGMGSCAASFEQVLEDPNVQVVSIASYDDAHFRQVVAGLRAGKHVFVEKPLCGLMDELRSIKHAWKQHGDRHLASNLVLRAAPAYRWLRGAIEAGDLGEIYAFDGDYLYGRVHKIIEGWRKDVENYSVMLGGGIHLVDLMLWLTAQRPDSVTAVGNRICTAGSSFRYHDYMAATFQFASGLIGRITANFGCAHGHQHVVRVFGTRGTFIYDDLGPRLHKGRAPSSSAAPLNLPALPDSKGDLIPGFIEAILSAKDTRAQTQQDFDAIAACLAANQALAAGKSREIEYV
jgi:predicted dehydrogenase